MRAETVRHSSTYFILYWYTEWHIDVFQILHRSVFSDQIYVSAQKWLISPVLKSKREMTTSIHVIWATVHNTWLLCGSIQQIGSKVFCTKCYPGILVIFCFEVCDTPSALGVITIRVSRLKLPLVRLVVQQFGLHGIHQVSTLFGLLVESIWDPSTKRASIVGSVSMSYCYPGHWPLLVHVSIGQTVIEC